MFEQGGRGSSVRHLNPSDNRGAGLVSAANVEASQKEPSTDYCRRLMMSEKVEKLLSAASSALSDSPAILDPGLLASDGSVLSELVELLQKRNGFYALESALHVFPCSSVNGAIGLDRWNAESLWRAAYSDMASGCLFFAEDVFGGHFASRTIGFIAPIRRLVAWKLSLTLWRFGREQ